MNNDAGAPNKKLVLKLFLAVGGMFAFGFLLVPIYDVICDITGLNGKTSGRYQVDTQQAVQDERSITVQFTARNNAGMVWEFKPNESSLVVSPGEVRVVSYRVHNPTDQVMTGQAIPSVAPSAAAAYLNKIECFCFQEQELQPGEEMDMTLRFFVDEALPERISKLTLAYSLYDITKPEKVKAGIDLAGN